MYRNEATIARLRKELSAEEAKPVNPGTIIPAPALGMADRPSLAPNKDECRGIAANLSAAFVWSATREGSEFWGSVRTRVSELSRHPNAY